MATARGRIMEEVTNVMIQFCGVQVRPEDIVLADKSGVVIIPQEKVDEVLDKAEELYLKEEDTVAEILKGTPMIQVDEKYNYEKMLK